MTLSLTSNSNMLHKMLLQEMQAWCLWRGALAVVENACSDSDGDFLSNSGTTTFEETGRIQRKNNKL